MAVKSQPHSEICTLGTVKYLALRYRIFDFVHFDFTETLDLQKITTRGSMHGSNRVITICFEFRNVYCTNAMRLDCIDIDYEAVLWEW
jgi:hypothetical protein